MTHAGGSYSARTLGEFEEIAERDWEGAVTAAERLRMAGYSIDIVSVGSTPTVRYARTLDGVTEARVGVYAFGDLVQSQLGTCTIDDIAISVLASVIGHNRSQGRVLVDSGFLALSRDRGTAEFPVDWGYGAVCDAATGELIDGVRVHSTNQEHGIITATSGELDWSRFPIGGRVDSAQPRLRDRRRLRSLCRYRRINGHHRRVGARNRLVRPDPPWNSKSAHSAGSRLPSRSALVS